MTEQILRAVRAFERWWNGRSVDLEAVLPDLLALPAPELLRQIRMHPDLRTPTILRRLLVAAQDALDGSPSRARDLTAIVAHFARSMDAPPEFAFAARTLQGEAWREHARALRAIGRSEKAAEAVRRARACFEDTPAGPWLLATLDLIEAPLLHDRGLHEEALRQIRRASESFRRAHDQRRYLEGRVYESWMLWAAGDRAGSAEVWKATADAARAQGDAELMARLAAKMGVFELRYGSVEEASRLLAAALGLFHDTPASEEAARVGWNLAEALAGRGRVPNAISEYHKVCAQLLAGGSLHRAAIAAIELLDLYLVAGREDQLPSLTETFGQLFRDAGMPLNAMKALAWLRGRANADRLTHEDLAHARAFFEELAQAPYRRFRAP